MKQFGAVSFVGPLVALGIVREMGPLITAILLAGRSSAAFAAEIGTMTVNSEVDALVSGGLSPMRFLVVPECLPEFWLPHTDFICRYCQHLRLDVHNANLRHPLSEFLQWHA